jgi:hypothetical protein
MLQGLATDKVARVDGHDATLPLQKPIPASDLLTSLNGRVLHHKMNAIDRQNEIKKTALVFPINPNDPPADAKEEQRIKKLARDRNMYVDTIAGWRAKHDKCGILYNRKIRLHAFKRMKDLHG